MWLLLLRLVAAVVVASGSWWLGRTGRSAVVADVVAAVAAADGVVVAAAAVASVVDGERDPCWGSWGSWGWRKAANLRKWKSTRRTRPSPGPIWCSKCPPLNELNRIELCLERWCWKWVPHRELQKASWRDNRCWLTGRKLGGQGKWINQPRGQLWCHQRFQLQGKNQSVFFNSPMPKENNQKEKHVDAATWLWYQFHNLLRPDWFKVKKIFQLPASGPIGPKSNAIRQVTNTDTGMLRAINSVYKHVGGKGQGSEENMAPHLYETNQLSDQQQTLGRVYPIKPQRRLAPVSPVT